MQESSTYQAILREGRVAGIAEGKAEEARNLILRMGTKRFGEPTPNVVPALSALSLTRLEDLALRLLEVESWEELLSG